MLSLQQKLQLGNSSFTYWANEFIKLEHGIKFGFKDHKYLMKGYTDKHPRIVEKKATQLGLTTKAILKSFHGCINRFPLGVMYFFPTGTDVRKFSRGRVTPLLEKNPESLKAHCQDTDNVELKSVGKSFIYFSGMKTAVSVKSTPADMLVFDEYDEADPKAIDMARQRTAHSSFREEIALSNPTIPGYGIDAEFQASDQNYWMIRCGCGHWNNVVEQFEAFVAGKGENNLEKNNWNYRVLICLKCRKIIDRTKGEWVAKYPSVKDVRGYQYSQLIAPHTNLNQLWKDYQVALKKGTLTIFHNLQLGLAHETGDEALGKEQVLELCDPSFPANPWALPGPTYMGVDQGLLLHIVFKKYAKGKILTWFVIEQDFEALDKYMDSVARCVIDALPETRKAREFAMRFRGRVYLNFYNENQKGSTKWDEEQFISQENRTESLDASHSVYKSKQIVLPSRTPEVEEFAEHCKNIAKKLDEDEKTGSKRYIWVKRGPDHFRHADNYANIAMSEAGIGLSYI